MNFYHPILLSLSLMAMASSEDECGPGCKSTNSTDVHAFCMPDFRHVLSDLRHSSVAPWKWSTNAVAGREPAYIQYADCSGCNVEHMIAKPIIIEISVYHPIRAAKPTWCKCPFNLAVGCTCVSKQ